MEAGRAHHCRIQLPKPYSFASYCHSLAYALSLAFLSFSLSFCSGTAWFPPPSDTAWFSNSLVLPSHLSGWRFFCSWWFFYSCNMLLRVSYVCSSCVCSTRLLIQRACRRPHVECHEICGRVRPLSDRKVTVLSVSLSVCRSVGRSVGRNQSVGKQSVRRK